MGCGRDAAQTHEKINNNNIIITKENIMKHMNEPTRPPFDLHVHGSGAFITFEIGDAVALPLLSLSKAILRGERSAEIVLSFAELQLVIEGSGLEPLFEHLLSGRVKSIRAGVYEACRVDKITAHDSA
ncbi:hypothetical protein [Opitutus sp. ER46]|uniref:hypothetical protein n=1 Tax=Opitutus sp. ER46 TaxID=2161864 RepID=UPI000D3140F3|nr:hypothetical protein [Opitutus sp. ER46]PTY00142.1 hypothetical protein DB354_02310 [Opitutus sp. ER46]